MKEIKDLNKWVVHIVSLEGPILLKSKFFLILSLDLMQCQSNFGNSLCRYQQTNSKMYIEKQNI